MKKSDFVSMTIMLCSLILILPQTSLAKATGAHRQKKIIYKTKYVDDYFEVDKYGRSKINIFVGDQKVSTIQDNNIYFNLDNHLDSTTLVTDEKGNIVETNDYDDFGNLISSDSQIRNNDKFLGQELDRETDLSYLTNRYYDGQTARFMSIDPLALASPRRFLGDPQQLNSYSYARNNPISLWDKNGLKVSEFQPYYSSEGFYAEGSAYGTYRGVQVMSAGDKSGQGDHEYQCVDWAKAFSSAQYGIDLSGTGNAYDYGFQSSFDNNELGDEYTVYDNGSSVMPQENDIISWSGGDWGHVGIIAEVSFDDKSGEGYVYTLEQNYNGNQGLYTQRFQRSYNNGKAVYNIENRSSLNVQGWVRNNRQSTIPYSNILYTPAPGNYIYNH